jgi:hypothetical protein
MPVRKVYWKGLRLVLTAAKSYIQRHQTQLVDHLTTEQYNCVVDTLTAIISCLNLLPTNNPVD